MDVNRREAYYQLIYTLLYCAEGQESEILMVNQHLIDDGLVETMQQVAALIEGGDREGAKFLMNIAADLEAATRDAILVSAHHDFLMQLLQATTDSNGNMRDVYPLLEVNLDKLDDNFIQVFCTWATATLSQEEPKDALDTAAVIVYFSVGMIDFHLGNREINLEIAIAGLEVASPITLTANPPAWGMLQCCLSDAYNDRIRGDRADNQEKAIAAAKSAFQVFNRDTVPPGWALGQKTLGLAYYGRILGEREDNLEAAIACYEAALKVYTRQQFPKEWAACQSHLGIAYRHRLLGDKAENIEKAIACYEAVSQVYTRKAFPHLWAVNQNNLGLVYNDRILGEKADNLEKAISCYEAAFQVHNRKYYPEDWARIQNNLGRVYFFRIKGDKAENVEKAIACCEAALSVRTREALPNYWARTQNNLGNAYCHRIKGDLAKNLQMAIDCFENALQVHTREAFPECWREIQDDLATARRALDELSQDEEFNQIASQYLELHRELLHLLLPLQFRTSKTVVPGDLPRDDRIPNFLDEIFDAIVKAKGDLQAAYPILQANLDKINEDFLQRFQYWTAMAFSAVSSQQMADLLRQSKTTDPSLLNLEPTVLAGLKLTFTIFHFSNLMLEFPLGNQAINAEIALTGYDVLTTVFTRENFPEEWAGVQVNLGTAYQHRIKGERAENLEAGIIACEAALQVFTREDFPEKWAGAQIALGTGYCERIYGNRADNLEMAIACVQNAAQVYTRHDFPQQWANIQDLRSVVYRHRIRGCRADNLEMAIDFSHQALQVITREKFPENWACIQHNLGLAYCYRIKGDQSENTEMAIACYERVLQVKTREAFPADWAAAQSNLGIVYRDRIRGDRVENLEVAICCYQNALQVRTKEAFPEKWAETQTNLGSAYRHRIKGDRAENLEMAIACAENALQIRTKEAFPKDWAATQMNLGNAYGNRIRGDRRENLNKMISALEASLQVHTRTDFPYEWAMTQGNLMSAYSELYLIDAAITCGRSALELFTPTGFPDHCLQFGCKLGNIAFAVGLWSEAIEGYTQAIEAVETSRTWATSESRRQEILRDAIDIYPKMVQACINTGQLDKAIETVERSRSKRLVDLMASNDLYSGGEIPPEVEEYLQQYENLQRQIDQQRSQNNSQGDSSPRSRAAWQAYNEAIAALESQKQFVWEQLRRLDPVLAGQIQVEAPKLSSIQQLLNQPTTAILSFYTTDSDTHIFVIQQNQISLHTCTGQGFATLQNWIFANWLQPYINDKDQWKNQINSVLTELAQRLQLDELIAQHLTDIDELIIVPHLELHQIPFAALPVTENQFLGDKFLIRYIPSCQVLELCQKRPPVGENLIYGTVEDATGDLPCASFEGEQIAQLHNISDERRLKGSTQATVSNYRQLIKQVQGMLSSHHAHSRLDRPLESQLKLGDGSITLGQLMTPGWRLPHLSDVFLSCCETGLGVTEITDDILTLSTGFLCAGARSAVSTLWSVDDFATALFSIFYHRYRQQGFHRPEALRRSQVELRTLTGDTLAATYQPKITHFLEKSLKYAYATRKEAKTERDRHPQDSSDFQQWDLEFKSRTKMCDRIGNTIKHLKFLCCESLPFSHPFYWAAFICSGLQ